MNRADINYWLRPKFDHTPPTDEELTRGRLITKSQHARILADDIKGMLADGFSKENIAFKVDQLARMVKDEPEEEPEEGSDE